MRELMFIPLIALVAVSQDRVTVQDEFTGETKTYFVKQDHRHNNLQITKEQIDDINRYYHNRSKKKLIEKYQKENWPYRKLFIEACKEGLSTDPDIKELLAIVKDEENKKRLMNNYP